MPRDLENKSYAAEVWRKNRCLDVPTFLAFPAATSRGRCTET